MAKMLAQAHRLLVSCFVMLLAWPSVATASRAVPRLPRPAWSSAAGPTELTARASSEEDAAAEPEDERRRYGAGKLAVIAPELGYIFFPRSELEVRGFRAIVEPRNGLIAKAGLALGGHFLGFEITPIFAMESGGINAESTGFGNLNLNLSAGSSGVNLFGVGGQMQMVVRIPIRRVVLSAGLGVHATYLFGDDIEYGTELYGRLPLGVHVHLNRRIAVFAEFGFMSGVTGIKSPIRLPNEGVFATIPHRAELEAASTPQEVEAWVMAHRGELEAWVLENKDDLPEGYDPQTLAGDFVQDEFAKVVRFGSGIGFDFAIGFRF